MFYFAFDITFVSVSDIVSITTARNRRNTG